MIDSNLILIGLSLVAIVAVDEAYCRYRERAGRREDLEARTPPLPIATMVTRHPRGATAIARLWEPGDTRRCRKCSSCSADHELGLCLVSTVRHVPRGEVWGFDCSARPMLRSDGTIAKPLGLEA